MLLLNVCRYERRGAVRFIVSGKVMGLAGSFFKYKYSVRIKRTDMVKLRNQNQRIISGGVGAHLNISDRGSRSLNLRVPS